LGKSAFNRSQFEESVFKPSPLFSFNDLCLNLFHHQYENNPVYREYADLLKIRPDFIQKAHQIPFLPIRFFKSREIKTGNWKEEIIFTSSGTTGDLTTKHFVKNI
jgi:phenylacetate-coenzyme A ligase PaaK-like adenylate-forming protein